MAGFLKALRTGLARLVGSGDEAAGDRGARPPAEVVVRYDMPLSGGQRADDEAAEMTAGWEFVATMQLRTPLRVLRLHRQFSPGIDPPPVVTQEMWEGIWVRRLKSWRELGLDIDGSPNADGTMASEIGQIPKDGGDFLRYLVALRSIVERESSIEERMEALATELERPEWADFVQRMGGQRAIIDRFFPPFVSALPGLTEEARAGLTAAGLVTPWGILGAPDAQMLAIRGIGPSKMAAIRAACVGATNPGSERVDVVQR